jgi:D-citramalate synthase
LTFVDNGLSIEWMKIGNCSKFINQRILNHCIIKKKTPEQHFTEIAQTITLAQDNIETNVYLEDWSNGMRNSLNMCLNI